VPGTSLVGAGCAGKTYTLRQEAGKGLEVGRWATEPCLVGSVGRSCAGITIPKLTRRDAYTPITPMGCAHFPNTSPVSGAAFEAGRRG
jgi:hypothetical protein